jgi:hypothetical protein
MNYAIDCFDKLTGHYLLVHSDVSHFENQLVKKDCSFCKFGEETTLNGFFCKPAQFIGFDPDNEKVAIFFLGSEVGLYASMYYYEDILILNENRIFKMYSARGGRDFNFKSGKWK